MADNTELKKAIRNLLINDSRYLRLMGDPSDDVKHTYYLRAPIRPTFPETVYNIRPSAVNQLFEESFIVGNYSMSFSVWAQTNAYEEIASRIIFLLHHKNNTEGFCAILIREPTEIFDNDFNAYGVTFDFDLHTRRATV